MRALPLSFRSKPLIQRSMFVESRTSAATILQPLQTERAARKYLAARPGLLWVGCETWFASFQTPISRVSGNSLRKRLTFFLYFLTLGALQTLRFEYFPFW